MLAKEFSRIDQFRKQLVQDSSVSSLVAALVSTMVGYAGPLLIIFQAAKLAGLTDEQLSSWIWAISLGSGITTLGLSAWYRVPVITAWSTPGAVLLVSSWSQYAYSDAIGAFIVSALLITLLGVTGLFSRVMDKIPGSITAAMLAGVLLKFGFDVFLSLQALPVLVIPMILTYLATKRLLPRYAVIATLLVGIGGAIIMNRLDLSSVQMTMVTPVWTTPSFSLDALIGLAIPLCIVTMTAQNATGIGVLRSYGYKTPASPLITATGFTSLILAPFGAHGINLAAITAAICTSEESHKNPDKRYVAGMAAGILYLLYGLGGATIASFFGAFPKELILVIGGLALFSSISASLTQAMDTQHKESALLTFLVTASGITIAGIGSAFWGLIAGVCAHYIFTASFQRQKGVAKASQGTP
ncbi:benzoate/H(+) symporter BenE family transporter [Brevibacillus ruminantium]|uniref:Benzoate/H(+) symporter BenE family transporter n=1 Tax=Brevibacillus ruminantium TaxID=2950604 RepID=A0ABY4WM48_9BACL|nr:benzoate/H(+) symporter BenE family transporter [Brevibacillus ruminantium]USG68235.1 benzoate/H(+) symporter BenE family transporter [Brevibacillus ruminantium]